VRNKFLNFSQIGSATAELVVALPLLISLALVGLRFVGTTIEQERLRYLAEGIVQAVMRDESHAAITRELTKALPNAEFTFSEADDGESFHSDCSLRSGERASSGLPMISSGPRHDGGGASLLTLTFALLLIGVSALGAIEITHLALRRAEVRKIESLALAAMDRAGGWPELACTLLGENPALTCEFGGGEITVRAPKLPAIPVGWRGSREL